MYIISISYINSILMKPALGKVGKGYIPCTKTFAWVDLDITVRTGFEIEKSSPLYGLFWASDMKILHVWRLRSTTDADAAETVQPLAPDTALTRPYGSSPQHPSLANPQTPQLLRFPGWPTKGRGIAFWRLLIAFTFRHVRSWFLNPNRDERV